MAKANGDTSQSPLAQKNAPPHLPPLSDNSPQSGLVPQSGGDVPSSQVTSDIGVVQVVVLTRNRPPQPPPATDKQAITVPPISPSQSSGLSNSKPLPDVPPTQALQQTGDTSLGPGFPGAEEPGEMTQFLSHTDSSHEGNTTRSHTR